MGSCSCIASLLFLLSLALIFSLNSAVQTDMEFIKTSCSTTAYPKLCYASLSNRASAIQASPKLLAQNALSVTLDTTKSTSVVMLKLSQVHGMTPKEVGAMRDCLEMLSDSVDELSESVEEMSHPGSKDIRLILSDIQTWVSAALTDEDTCTDGFSGRGKMKYVLRGKIVNVAHLTSNALALINAYASSLHA